MVVIAWIIFLVVLAQLEHHEEVRDGVGLLWWEYYTPSLLLRVMSITR